MKYILTILLFISLAARSQDNVPMKDYVDMQNDLTRKIVEQQKEWSIRYSDAQLQALREATELVRLSLDEYKTVNNEWRGQIKDASQTYITQQTFFSVISAMGVIVGLLIAYTNLKKKDTEKFREGTKEDKIKKETA